MLLGRWAHIWHGLHTSVARHAVDKALLSKLRKKTGFPFINCKKALEKFENDLQKAETWLRQEAQKEGWAKASKLQNRPMSQGLVGIVIENNMAAMVEVNCETDFVARNDKFRSLVSKVANSCLQLGKQSSTNKVIMDKAEVDKLSVKDSGTLADLVALTVGNIGENMSSRRAVFLRAADDLRIGTYVHSAGPHIIKDNMCVMGKYGALVTFRQTGEPQEEGITTEELGRQLSQHVVGMNPKTVLPSEELVDSKEEVQPRSEQTEVEEKEHDGKEEEKKLKIDENAMINQEFLLDESITVKEYLEKNQAEVLDFIRYECGESLPGDDD